MKTYADGTYRVGRLERSNACLGAAAQTGARHEQCDGTWRQTPKSFPISCGCSCHAENSSEMARALIERSRAARAGLDGT